MTMHVSDVQHLFQNFTHTELQDVKRKLENEVQKKGDEIKELISQRYRDVIEASDAIDELVNISVQAITDFNVSTLPSKGTTNVSSDTHRIQQIIDRKKFWTSINNGDVMVLVYRFHEDENFISNLDCQGTKAVLNGCLERRRKVILLKCWETINRLPQDINRSRTCLIVIASLTGSSMSGLAKMYLKMIETELKCEKEDEQLLKRLVIKLINSLSYFNLLFDGNVLQDLVNKTELKNVKGMKNDEFGKIVPEWTSRVLNMIESLITSSLSKADCIDRIFSLGAMFDRVWKCELDESQLSAASSACNLDISNIKPRIDNFILNIVSTKIDCQLSKLFESIKSIKNESPNLGSSYVWNLIDDDLKLKEKSQLYSSDEYLSLFDHDSKLFLEGCSCLYGPSSYDVITKAKLVLKDKLIEEANSIVDVFQQNQNDLGVIERCNALLCNSYFRCLCSESWPDVEKLISNLRSEKCKFVLLPQMDRLGKKLGHDLEITPSFRPVTSSDNQGKLTAASWLPTNISLPLYSLLTGTANEINYFLAHSMPVDSYPFIWGKLRDVILSSYNHYLEFLISRRKSVPVRETFAGQAYFDLLFLKQILLSSPHESNRQDAILFQDTIKSFESLLDPFDLHIMSGELHSNLTNSIQNLSLILTIIWPGTNCYGTKSSKDKAPRIEAQVEQSNKKCPEFILIK